MSKEEFEPIDFNITRVSENKLRIKYKIPTYQKEGLKLTFMGYHNIGITIREITDPSTKTSTYQKWGISLKNSKIFTCFRPFDKYINKISNFYSIKKKNINLPNFPHYEIFEEKESFFILPRYIALEGKDVNAALRIWKIKRILKMDENSIDNQEVT